MRALLLGAAFAAAIATSGCSLTLNPDQIEPPRSSQRALRGACQTAPSGHIVCGSVSAGGLATSAAPGGHRIVHGQLNSGGNPRISSPQHQIVHGRVQF